MAPECHKMSPQALFFHRYSEATMPSILLARVHAADRTYITSQAFVWTNGDDYESDE